MLNERDLLVVQEPTVPKCRFCLSTERHFRLQWYHVPPVLRRPTKEQVIALSPLNVHRYDVVQSVTGYMRCTRFTRFSWEMDGLMDRIVSLPQDDCDSVLGAYEFLMSNREFAYLDFERRRWENVSTGWLPYKFILESHLDNALFPDLYPFRHSSDEQRGPGLRGKRSFWAKATSAVLDYCCHARLIQFVYDRWQWRTIEQAQSVALQRGVTLSYILSEKTFSPEYMINAQASVVDVVRQYGPSAWFWTFAPAEWHFPLHKCVTDIKVQTEAFDYFSVGGMVSMSMRHTMAWERQAMEVEK